MEIETAKTCRGFNFMRFKDRYNHTCSIQESSLATENAIWFGVDDPEPKVMARSYPGLNTKPLDDPERENGWIPYPIPSDVSITTRMHLTQDQVAELIPILQNFVDTGLVGVPKKKKKKK